MMSEADIIIQNNPHYGASSQLQAQFQQPSHFQTNYGDQTYGGSQQPF